MPLNLSTGNMYDFISHTWNVIKGKCPFDCNYCYMKRFPQKNMRFDADELKIDLGQDNFIFVGSSCDMWNDRIYDEQIICILKHCKKYYNKYLFQSKNPQRFIHFLHMDYFSDNIVLASTIETNRKTISKAPDTFERLKSLIEIKELRLIDVPLMITIEPIMDFDDELIEWIKMIEPSYVSIGADSQNMGLPEPDKKQINHLISEINGFTKIFIKKNLKRLL